MNARDPLLTVVVGDCDSQLAPFEQAWQAGTQPSISDFVAALGAPESTRQRILRGLVAIDLDYRWKLAGSIETVTRAHDDSAAPAAADFSCKPRLEEYLRRFPEIGPLDLVPTELIVLEYSVRQRGGDHPDPAEYARRFPEQAAALRTALAAADRELAACGAPASAMSDVRTPDLATSPRPELKLPEIENYEVLGVLGKGGMGMVLKARHRVLGRLVAIKMPLAGQLADADERERFFREARAAARLHHPHICPIHEVGESQGRPYLALHFVAGPTLRDWSIGHKPTAHEAATLISRIARAVGYAHQHGVVHRDLKPTNVMIDSETGQPVLMDFGLAKQLDEDRSLLTHTGQVLGTPAYMSPEQAAGRLEKVGPRSDIYGLGAMLYELVCGRRPFEGGVGDVLQQLQADEPPPPRKLNPRLHRDLETICLKAIAKEPLARYATAEALADDLERFAAGEAILARPEASWRKAARRVRRNAGLAGALVLLAIAVTAGVYFAVTSRHAVRLAGLKTRLDAELQGHEWTAGRLRELDALAGALGRHDPALGTEAAGQIQTRLTADISSAIDSGGRMTSEEQTRIESEIRLLEERDPDQAADLRGKLAARLVKWNTVFELPGEAGELQRAFKPAQVKQSGKLLTATADLSTGRPRVVARLGAEGPAQFDATFDANWDSAPEVGLLLSVGAQQEYAFLLIAPDNRSERDKEKTDSRPPTLADGRRRGADFVIEIQRNGTRLRGNSVPSEAVPRGPLHLRARREGDTLVFRLNDIPELKFVDLFPLRAVEGNGYGVVWPAGVGIARLSAEHQLLPASPSRLEQADELFLRGEWEAARRVYDEQARTEDVELRREADYKAALCWLQAGDDAEALARFEKLQQADAGSGKWPLRAACQIWVIQLKRKEFEKAEAAFDALNALSVADDFAVVLSEQDRGAVVAAYSVSGVERLTADQRNLDRLERAEEVYKLVGAEMVWQIYTQADFIQMLEGKGERARALEKAEQFMNEVPVGCGYDAQFLERYGTIARLPGGNLSDLTNPLRQVNRLLYKRPGVYRSDFYVGLLVERARLHAAQQDFIAAENDLDEFDRYRSTNSDPLSNYLPRFAAEAGLVRGFLREMNGDAAGALAAWKAALAILRGAPAFEHADMNAYTVLCRTILASLTETPLSNQEIDFCFRSLRTSLKGGSASLDGLLKNEQLFSGFVPRESLGRGLLGMWRSPRGRSVARGIALRNLSHRDATLQPLLLALTEHMRHEALSGATSQEQEALLWNFSEHVAEGIFKGGIGPGDMIRMAYAWTRGGNDEFGWQGARKSKWLSNRPEVRGVFAYVLGQRFLQKGWPADGLFREVVKDAPAGSSLARLAQFEVDHVAARKELTVLAAEAKRTGGDPSTLEAAALRGRLLDFWRQHRDTPLGPAAFKLASDGIAWPADLLLRDHIPPEVLALAGLGDARGPPEDLVGVLGGPPAAHWEPIRALAISPDAVTLATGSSDGNIRLWSLPDGKYLRTLAGHVAAVVSLEFARTGQSLASGSDDGTCRVWSVADGTESLTLRGHSGRVSTLAFDSDGKQLVSGGWDGAVKVWELTSGVERHSLAGEMSEVHAVARVDENRLAVAHENGEVRLWDLDDERLVHKWAAHTGQARALVTSSDGRQLVSGGADARLRIWNLAQGDQEPRTIDAVVAPHTVAFTADGQTIVTAGADGMARRFDAATGTAQPPLAARAYYAAAFDPRRNVLVAASVHNQVEQLDLATGELRPLIAGHVAALAVAWSPDGATLAATNADGAIRLWNVATGQLARTLVEQGPPALSLAFHPHDRILAAGKSDGKLALWETSGNEAPREWTGHAAQINRVALSPDGKVLASAAHDGTVKMWTIADGLQIGECRGYNAAVTALAFAPDGQTLATGSSESAPRLWDLTGTELIPAFEPGNAAVFDLAFNPLPGQLAAVGANGAVTIWGLADRKIQAAYPTILGRALTFSPDGRSMAVACNDGQVRFFNPAFFDPKLPVPESAFRIGPPAGIIRQAAYSPDGRHLALTTGAGTVYVLRLESRGER